MSKRIRIEDNDIYVQSERHHSSKESDEHVYSLWVYGEQTFCELTSNDVLEIIACLQHALEVNEKGGSK